MKRKSTGTNNKLNVLRILFLVNLWVITQTNCLTYKATKLTAIPNSCFSYSNQNAVYCNYTELSEIVEINYEKNMSTCMKSGLKRCIIAQNASPSLHEVFMLHTRTFLYPTVCRLLHSSKASLPLNVQDPLFFRFRSISVKLRADH